MPFLKVKLSIQESSVTSARVATILTDLITEILRKKRELTAVEIEYVDSNRWFVGGSLLRDQNVNSFYLEIKITDGTNTKDEKARYVAQVFSAIEAIIGPLALASYVVVLEVPADAWGYETQTQEFRYIKGRPL